MPPLLCPRLYGQHWALGDIRKDFLCSNGLCTQSFALLNDSQKQFLLPCTWKAKACHFTLAVRPCLASCSGECHLPVKVPRRGGLGLTFQILYIDRSSFTIVTISEGTVETIHGMATPDWFHELGSRVSFSFSNFWAIPGNY